MNRSRSVLRSLQAEVLAEYRAARTTTSPATLAPRPGVTSVAAYGRVVSIITSDAEHGAHLVVVRLTWAGTPPAPTDAAGAETRCYPAPGRTVAAFSVNELVRLAPALGAMMAEKLA